MKRGITCFLLIVTCLSVFGQWNKPTLETGEPLEVENIHGEIPANKSLEKISGQEKSRINPYLLNNKWSASWISYPGVSLTDYGVFHFRKTFSLPDKPSMFTVHVSGDNRYRLFINGVEVCKGPARGDPANWRFETVDIAKHLKSGKNTIAAVVWNFGEYRPLAQMTNQTAFILQGNGNRENVVNTDRSWKVYKNEAYIRPKVKPPRTVVGSSEMLDASEYPFGWETVEYNDEAWSVPRTLGKGVPNGKFTGWGWNLIPRNIPFMEYTFQRIKSVRRSSGIEAGEGFLKGKAPLEIPANRKVSILLDQTYLTTAYPELVVDGGKGSSIRISYGEAMVDEHGVKGNRNKIDGKTIQSYYADTFLPDGGKNRHFQPLWFRTYRYLELTVETKDEPLVIRDIYGYFTAYPFQEKALFRSDAPILDSIWDTGWRTARLCAGETYYDCPYYEQLQYVGDTRIQALISLYVAGDDRLMRNAITQFRNSLLPMGLTQSRYPSSQTQVIPPFSLIWIEMVHDYWMHRDDRGFVKEQLNGIRNILHWYEQQIAHNGMLGPMDWWNFVDWSFGRWNGDKPIGGAPQGVLDGNSSIITLQYVSALQKAAELFNVFDKTHEADRFHRLARGLLKKTRNHCWSKKRGLLANTPEKNSFSQHANILAILTGMFDPSESLKIFEKIQDNKDLTPATFYFRFYLVRAMKKVRKANDYIEMLQPWEEMLNLGLTTFAETPEPTRSDCHAWSAHPNYDLLATVCGVTPASPGFKSVNITPHLGNLEFVECEIPHPNGNISLQLKKKKNGGIKAEIKLPEGLPGTFRWKNRELSLQAGKKSTFEW